MRRNVLNSKAGYNWSGVARLTIREEDMSHKQTDPMDHRPESYNRMAKDGKLEMARKALERMKEEMDRYKKRIRDDDITTKPRKHEKLRKLNYNLEEEDWGAEMQELEALE